MIALLLIPLYALADRFAGGGWPALDARLPGRGLAWGAALCALVGWFALGLPGVLLALAWGVYRSLPLGLFGGRSDPRSLDDAIPVLGRHALVVPALGLIGWQLLDRGAAAILAGLLYAVLATVLALAYGRSIAEREAVGEPEGAENAAIELMRGAVFGAAVLLIAF